LEVHLPQVPAGFAEALCEGRAGLAAARALLEPCRQTRRSRWLSWSGPASTWGVGLCGQGGGGSHRRARGGV